MTYNSTISPSSRKSISVFPYAIFAPFSASDFTGKETDCETSYSYFGARYYDPTLLTSWTAVDPMSDKYPSLSPYNYCAWNPIKLVDPDGNEIWIRDDDGNKYKYENGKIVDKNNKECTNDGFAQRVCSDLNTLKGNGMNDQISKLETNKNKVTIVHILGENEWAPSPSEDNKVCSIVKYDPSILSCKGWTRPSVVGLAHEMQHAYEYDQKILDSSPLNGLWKYVLEGFWIGLPTKRVGEVDIPYTNCTDPIDVSELHAIKTANQVFMSLKNSGNLDCAGKPKTRIDGFSIKKYL